MPQTAATAAVQRGSSEASRRELASKLVDEYDIRPGNYRFLPATSLAVTVKGGSSRSVGRCELLIAAHPPRVDIGSPSLSAPSSLPQEEGKAILLVSADLEEIMSLSDRIAVMFEGRIVGILPASEANEQVLGLMMAGGEYWRAQREEDEVVEA